jgi:hypothetical protein
MVHRNPHTSEKGKYTPCTRLMFVLMFISSSLGLAQTAEDSPKTDAEEHWIALFNGKNLDGWVPKFAGCKLGDNFAETFRVEDGLLKVVYDQYETFDNRFGHLFYRMPLSHYRLRVEYRFVDEQVDGGPGWAYRNSGIMLHCQDPNTMGLNQSFPVSIEVQLLGGDGHNKRPTLNVCTPGTHIVLDGKLETRHCINSTSETYHGDQWVIAEVEVRGSEVIRHYANGKLVLEYSQPQLDENDPDAKKLIKDGNTLLTGGYISLQAESHPCEFRRVEMLPLE